MSGGRLVVLDRQGRNVKQFPLASGLATLGSDPRCDIRVTLPDVCAHHATVVVHANQTVVRNVGDGETLVNGRAVSVAALRDGDRITVGGRHLRWDYTESGRSRPLEPQPALYNASRRVRSRTRNSAGGLAAPRSPALQLALELQHRASMPGSAGGKQVAIVQPQRRDTTEQNASLGASSPRTATPKRQRPAPLPDSPDADGRKPPPRPGPKHAATKASLWIESRKRGTPGDKIEKSPASRAGVASARKATPLRLAVLRRAASLGKVQPPRELDQTKQVAIMLMTGHTRRTPSFVAKRTSPNTRNTPTPNKSSRVSVNRRTSGRTSGGESVTILEITDSPRQSSPRVRPTRSRGNSQTSPLLPSPKKSAMKDPTAKKSARKTESIKFDLSNLDNYSQAEQTMSNTDTSISEDDLTLHYDTSPVKSPSPRKSIHSRSSRIIEHTLGTTVEESPNRTTRSTMTPRSSRKSSRGSVIMQKASSRIIEHTLGTTVEESPNRTTRSTMTPRSSRKSSRGSVIMQKASSRIIEHTLGTTVEESPNRTTRSPMTPQSSRKSSRGSVIMQKALSGNESSRYSRRSTRTLTDQSFDTTVASAYRTKSLSPRSPRNNLETYSIVDLVSVDSNDTDRSVYDSAASANSSTSFGTPHNSSGRKTRSTINPVLVESSTPYIGKTKSLTRSRSSPNVSRPSSIKGNDSQTSVRSSSQTSLRSSSQTSLRNSSQISPRNSSQISARNSSQTSARNSSQTSARNSSQTSVRSSASTRRSKSQITPENTLKHITVDSTRISRGSRSRSRLSESDLLLISDNSFVEDESPRSSIKSRPSKSISPKKNTSKQSSPIKSISPKQDISTKSSADITRRSSRRTADATPSNATENEGTSTPENRHSPEEVGTPVLSIQSLLDSSQSSLASQKSHKKTRLSAKIKRKTIGVIRTEPKTRRSGGKSKSLNFTARRGLLTFTNDSSDKEDGDGDKMVTPKSGVKLVQEAVKNKHSTAKKPQSKRSIIDTLDESDIVKQLFNSPVKRKLSQSMTEFSRKQLFEEDEMAPVRRPTRNTIALTGRTPDNSILEQTEVFTPERFVSPIGTPANSPDLAGVKRIFRKNTPNNDLTDVRGVKTLLKTPRTRKSLKNDLTNVSGVKKVFAKSPKNRLSDVRVKEVFAEGPKDDLRRVSGVKSLFRAHEKKSPRNDLTDVRGVKNLFQKKSPKNDLRRVSGVKRTLRRHSPRNDLTDVRGVKRMYGEEKRRDDLNDVSGVEELFNESTASKDTDLLFDRLLGRPPIRAKYSKSFIKKPPPKKTNKAKVLHVSLEYITNNVEEWLEKELEKRLHKKSVNRELQNLTTNTIEGATPVIDSRVRRSIAANTERKSASETYSAHTLPIKKRSLPDRQSGDKSKSGNLSSILPLKKRQVVHSTPLKGRRPAAPAARESPIPPAADHDTSIGSDKQPKELPEPKSRRSTKTKPDTGPTPPQSPKRTRRTKGNSPKLISPKVTSPKVISPKVTSPKVISPKVNSPKVTSPKARATRARKTNDTTQTKAKKGRPSLVIAKKSPVMSPKPTRARRGKPEPAKETVEKPKNQKQDESPKDIPKVPTPKKTRGRKQVEVEEKVVPTPKKTRQKQPQQKVATPKNTRTRKTEDKPKEATPKRSRAKALKNVVVVTKPSPQMKPQKLTETRRPRKTTANDNESLRNTKRRKVESPKAKPTKPEPKLVETQAKRGRRTQAETKTETDANTTQSKPERKTRTRNLQPEESTQSEPTSKRRKNETEKTVIPEVRSRKRKATAEEVVPKKVAKNQAESEQPAKKTRGTKTADVVENKTTRGTKTTDEVESKTTRGRKTADVVENKTRRGTKTVDVVESKTTRGRKTADLVESKTTRGTKTVDVVESKTTRGTKTVDVVESKTTRGRKTADVEESKTTRGTKTAAVVESKTTRGRNTAVVVEKKTTRGKKTADVQESPQKQSNTRQKRGAAKQSEPETEVVAPPARGRKAAPAAPKANARNRKAEVKATPVKAEPQKTRATRARVAVEESAKPTGRSRRR